jgi:hypothetical protein
MANITVKDSANVDVVYTGVVPSSGDKTLAVWRANALSPMIAHRPTFSVVTRDNQRQNGRVFDGSFKFPIRETIGGVETVTATVPFTITGTLPTNVDSAKVLDAFTQLGNLLASSLLRSVAAEGYAPS